MTETRAETFHRLKAILLTPSADDIPLPTIVGAVEFRREQYGLKCREWACLLGMASSHYSDFAGGKKPLPRYAAARACKLGVPAEVFLQIEEPVEFREIEVPNRPYTMAKSHEELRIYNRDAKRRSRERARRAE